jgi:hypothetical protein
LVRTAHSVKAAADPPPALCRGRQHTDNRPLAAPPGAAEREKCEECEEYEQAVNARMRPPTAVLPTPPASRSTPMLRRAGADGQCARSGNADGWRLPARRQRTATQWQALLAKYAPALDVAELADWLNKRDAFV